MKAGYPPKLHAMYMAGDHYSAGVYCACPLHGGLAGNLIFIKQVHFVLKQIFC